MSEKEKNSLTSSDACDIMCSLIRQRADELTDYGSLEFNIKLEKHNGLITDAYLGRYTKDGFVMTEHIRNI